ncbi:AbiV family abortive infection protein [Candidatus Bathyarchaeota archaeon]|nr:AbiV family abortive infection protein [Candidatus Bathyarchaeota archaeon]
MSHPDRIIPVAKLPEGLRLCAQNIREFVADAQTLLSKGHGWHTIALAIFAFEELGKYAELRRIKESVKSGQDKVNVKDALFRSHDYKQNFARKLIPKEAMILLPAYFNNKYFGPEFFQTENVTPSDTLRVQCVFVDWIDDDWRYGAAHDTERLKKFLNAIMDALNQP